MLSEAGNEFMRVISAQTIITTVAAMCCRVNYHLAEGVWQAFSRAKKKETKAYPKYIFNQLQENAKIARQEKYPLCQDTGMVIVFAKIGEDVKIKGMTLSAAINEGVKKGYTLGYLRKSIVADPLLRKNTGDNTPAVIYTEITGGNQLVLSLLAKGGGSENASQAAVLKPSDGKEGVTDFVLSAIKKAGGNPCPPLLVGIGVGGSFDSCAVASKKALLRKIGSRHSVLFYAKWEKELKEKINRLNIGPMGLGGKTTVLDVFIQTLPCHIASLPVAVSVNCHSIRHEEVIL
jgi:fumarate hydratase subunit alpha